MDTSKKQRTPKSTFYFSLYVRGIINELKKEDAAVSKTSIRKIS